MPELTEVFKDMDIYSGREALGKVLPVLDVAVVTRHGDEVDLVCLKVRSKIEKACLVYSGGILLRRYAETIRMLCPCWVRFIAKGDFYTLEVYTKGAPDDAQAWIQEPPPPVETTPDGGANAPGDSRGHVDPDGAGI